MADLTFGPFSFAGASQAVTVILIEPGTLLTGFRAFASFACFVVSVRPALPFSSPAYPHPAARR